MKNQIIDAWKQFAATKTNTAKRTLTYILLRSDSPTEALYFIRKAFSPVKSSVKLSNGRKPYDCLWTGENYDMRYLLYSVPSPYSRNKIKDRIAEFGIEPTDELIDNFVEKATETLRKLKNDH
jgi:hypothetical protein